MAYTNLSDLFKGICDALRVKLGITGSINHQDIPTKILEIKTPTDGSIPTRTSSDFDVSGATVSFPAGYYASTHKGTVSTGALAKPTYTYSNGVITAKSGVSTSGYISSGTTSSGTTISDGNLVTSNIKSGVTIFGVTGEYSGGYSNYITSWGNSTISLPTGGTSLPTCVAAHFDSSTDVYVVGENVNDIFIITDFFITGGSMYCTALSSLNNTQHFGTLDNSYFSMTMDGSTLNVTIASSYDDYIFTPTYSGIFTEGPCGMYFPPYGSEFRYIVI